MCFLFLLYIHIFFNIYVIWQNFLKLEIKNYLVTNVESQRYQPFKENKIFDVGSRRQHRKLLTISKEVLRQLNDWVLEFIKNLFSYECSLKISSNIYFQIYICSYFRITHNRFSLEANIIKIIHLYKNYMTNEQKRMTITYISMTIMKT